MPVEQVIGAHLEQLFPGMEILSWSPFRVTRDADLDLEEDEAEDLLAAIESGLQRRRRLSDAVRLEIDRSMSERALDLLLEELELGPDDVYLNDALLDLGALWQLYERIPRPDLRDEPWVPQPVPRLPEGRGRAPPRLLRACCASATCWCTTPTTPSRRPSRSSSPRPPTTPTCSPSSTRSTGAPGPRTRSAAR